MPTTPAWPVHFAKHFCDYVIAGAGADDIPAVEDMRMSHQESAAIDKPPSLLVSCMPTGDSYAGKGKAALFKAIVHFRVRVDVTAGSESTLGPSVIAAIENRLLDDDAWASWTLEIDESLRTGWMILVRRPGTSVDIAVQGSEDQRDWILPLALTAIVQREHAA